MTFALYDLDPIVTDLINDSVRIVYSPTPITGLVASERFWLADSVITVSIYVLQ